MIEVDRCHNQPVAAKILGIGLSCAEIKAIADLLFYTYVLGSETRLSMLPAFDIF